MAADRILVLDADGRAGVACVQSLGAAGHDVHVGVRKLGSLTEQSRWCAQVHAQPAAEPVEAGAAWLVDLDARLGFALVVPTTEASLRWLRSLPETHAVRRKAVLPSDVALDAALDKATTSAIARELGLPVPAAREIAQHLPGIPAPDLPPPQSWPVVLKPVRSKVVIDGRLASMAVAIVHDEEARRVTLASWLPHTPVQEQAWVPGRGVGVEVLYENGRMAWHFVHERLHEWPLTGGASTLRRAGGADTELVDMTRRLLDRLHWHGVAMVEWRRDDLGVVHLMEINPRLWGSLPLTIASGVDIPRGLLALARGEALGPAPAWRVGFTARNLTEDIQWGINNLRADRSNPLLLTESPWRTALGWLRVLSGREVWDGWSWRDSAVGREELLRLVRSRFDALSRRVSKRAALARARRNHSAISHPSGGLSRPVRSVLFVCLGNLCRSPFAAVATARRLPGVTVESAGFLSHDGRPSPAHVVQVARTLGVDVSASRARRVTAEQIDAADLIVCMDVTHLERMAREFPHAMSKTTLLGLFNADGPTEMKDPYDLSPPATLAVFEDMLRSIDALVGDATRVDTPAVAS